MNDNERGRAYRLWCEVLDLIPQFKRPVFKQAVSGIEQTPDQWASFVLEKARQFVPEAHHGELGQLVAELGSLYRLEVGVGQRQAMLTGLWSALSDATLAMR